MNFMVVPLVRNRFAHTLHPAALAFVSYGIVLVQVQVQEDVGENENLSLLTIFMRRDYT